MRIFNRIATILIAFTAITGSLFPQTSASSASWQDKVDPWVLTTAAEGETEFLIYLTEQADLSPASALSSKLEKGTYVYEILSSLAERTQGPLLVELQRLGIEHRSYWVANMIWARGNLDAVQALANRLDVAHLYANPKVKMQEPSKDDEASIESPDTIEWNILKVNADDVWALGYNGDGAVIAGQDTGYEWDHPGIINQYRGWDGGPADHNYNWHDAIHSGGGTCGANSPEPCDDYGHGTHTMGTMVGDDGNNNQVGMAPGARWIGCRNMDQGVGTPATYSECYEWFIAPTDLNDENHDPSKAPHVINNSWGCPPSEGCTDPNVLLTVVQNVRAAGILSVHSAGNSGSACFTVDTPAAIYDASYSVGATDSSDNIAGFSSRGTVTIDGSHRLKPDISAPGVFVRSTVPGGGYGTMSGTSMAGPHVAGLVGLLISANSSLAGEVDLLEEIINISALPRISPQECDGIPGDEIPNPIYGWGRIDARAAVDWVHRLELSKSASDAAIEPGGILTYTLSVTHTHMTSPTYSVVLTDALPVDTTFVSASGPYTYSNGIVHWEFPILEAGAGVEVSLVVEVDPEASGEIVNADYSVSSNEVPEVWGLPLSTPVVPFDLALSKHAPPFTSPGSILTYTLTVTNPHPFAALSGVVLTDVLPTDTTFVSASEPYSFMDGVVNWGFSSLAANESEDVSLVVEVSPEAGDEIVNANYGAYSTEVQPVQGPPVTTLVFPYDLALSKRAPEVTSPGASLNYTLSVTNTHPTDALSGLVLTDSLPIHTSFISATVPFTVSDSLVTWTLPSLGAGEVWTRELVVQVPMTFTGTIANQLYGVRADQVETRLGDPVLTQIHALAVDKTASAEHVFAGDLLTYTLSVTNLHPLSPTHSLVLSDVLPLHTEFIHASGSFSMTNSAVIWEAPELGPGETWSEWLVVRVTSTANDLILNKDYAAWSMEAPMPIAGAPVSTRAGFRYNFPVVFKAP